MARGCHERRLYIYDARIHPGFALYPEPCTHTDQHVSESVSGRAQAAGVRRTQAVLRRALAAEFFVLFAGNHDGGVVEHDSHPLALLVATCVPSRRFCAVCTAAM